MGIREQARVPTFEGDEDARRGQRVNAQLVPESEAGQCQEDMDRPQTVQLHGRATSSGTPRAVNSFFYFFKSLQGQKETREKRRCVLNSKLQKTEKGFATMCCLFIYVTCQIHGSQGPHDPSEFW